MLVFLGYDVRRLDCRVLLRGVVNPLNDPFQRDRIAVFQIDPKDAEAPKGSELRDYIRGCREKVRIKVYYGTVRDFLGELRKRLEGDRAPAWISLRTPMSARRRSRRRTGTLLRPRRGGAAAAPLGAVGEGGAALLAVRGGQDLAAERPADPQPAQRGLRGPAGGRLDAVPPAGLTPRNVYSFSTLWHLDGDAANLAELAGRTLDAHLRSSRRTRMASAVPAS